MLAFLRWVGAFVVGYVVGGAANMAVVVLNAFLFLPRGLDFNDPVARSAALQDAPWTVFVLPVVAHAGGALVGAWLAAWLAGRARLAVGLLVGALFLVGGVMMLRDIPHPAWFPYVDLALYLPAAWVGVRLAGPGKPAVVPA
jgi:hypothetical protein